MDVGALWHLQHHQSNIATGTTDPGYWLYNLNHFSDRNQFEGGVTWFQVWPPGGVTCIGSNFGHKVPMIVLWHHRLVLSCYLHQPESHQLSLNKVELVSDTWTHRSDQGYLGPIKRRTIMSTRSHILKQLQVLVAPEENFIILVLQQSELAWDITNSPYGLTEKNKVREKGASHLILGNFPHTYLWSSLTIWIWGGSGDLMVIFFLILVCRQIYENTSE